MLKQNIGIIRCQGTQKGTPVVMPPRCYPQEMAGLVDLPVTVISHDQPQEVPGMPAEVNQAYEAAWQEMQREMAGMSSRGQQVTTWESGHMIHHQQPELLVGEIERMVMAWRG
jgi:hypothetical protein